MGEPATLLLGCTYAVLSEREHYSATTQLRPERLAL